MKIHTRTTGLLNVTLNGISILKIRARANSFLCAQPHVRGHQRPHLGVGLVSVADLQGGRPWLLLEDGAQRGRPKVVQAAHRVEGLSITATEFEGGTLETLAAQAE